MDRYIDLIQQTFDFPTEEFHVENGELFFHNISIKNLAEKYGTPFKLFYLPKIEENIQRVHNLFHKAFNKLNYSGNYTFCYCTKSSHFRFVLEEVIKQESQIELSSAYDISIVRKLYEDGLLTKDTLIICNGFKRDLYKAYIKDLIREGFTNCIPVLDNKNELKYYSDHLEGPIPLGIRVASDEEPDFDFYTSRLGIKYNDITDFYKTSIEPDSRFQLKFLHFFVNEGIKDTAYYWSELRRFIRKYAELKKLCPNLEAVDIGGGLPVKTSIYFDYDYEYMIEEIVGNIKEICNEEGVPEPDIYTEFGTYTVGEAGANIYSVLDEKWQNDKELWYMIDHSFITSLPDSWGMNQHFILMAVNNWLQPYQKVHLGGLTCDSMDYYNTEAYTSDIYMPEWQHSGETQYIGFFHTGAYQENLGGYGGLQHCLLPSPAIVTIAKNEEGELTDNLFAFEQRAESMMRILGYE